MAPSVMTDPPPQHPPRPMPYGGPIGGQGSQQLQQSMLHPGQAHMQPRAQVHPQMQQQYMHPSYGQPGSMQPQMHPNQAVAYQGYYQHQYPSTSYQIPQPPPANQSAQLSTHPIKAMPQVQPQQLQHMPYHPQPPQQQSIPPTCMQERQNLSTHQSYPSTSSLAQSRSPSRVPHPNAPSTSSQQHLNTAQWMSQHYMGGATQGQSSGYASPAPSVAPSVMSVMAANFETMSMLSVNTQMSCQTGAIPAPAAEDMPAGEMQSPQCFSSNGSNISAVENVNPQLVQRPQETLRQAIVQFRGARNLGEQVDSLERIYQIIGRSDANRESIQIGHELASAVFQTIYHGLQMFTTPAYRNIGPNNEQRQVEIFRHLLKSIHIILSLKEFRDSPTLFIPLDPNLPISTAFFQMLTFFLKSQDLTAINEILSIFIEIVKNKDLSNKYLSKLKDQNLINIIIGHLTHSRSFRIIYQAVVLLFYIQHGDIRIRQYLMPPDQPNNSIMSVFFQHTLPNLREAYHSIVTRCQNQNRDQLTRETRFFSNALECVFVLMRKLIEKPDSNDVARMRHFIQHNGIQIVGHFVQHDEKYASVQLLHLVSQSDALVDMPEQGNQQQLYLVEPFQLVLQAIPRMRPSKTLPNAIGFLYNATRNKPNNKIALIRLDGIRVLAGIIQRDARFDQYSEPLKSPSIFEQREVLNDTVELMCALIPHYGDPRIEEPRRQEDRGVLGDSQFLESLLNAMAFEKDFDADLKSTRSFLKLRSNVFKLLSLLLNNGIYDDLLSLKNDINDESFISNVLSIIETSYTRFSADKSLSSLSDSLVNRAIIVLLKCIELFNGAAKSQIADFWRYNPISPLEILTKRQSNDDLSINVLINVLTLCDEVVRFMHDVPQSWINYRSIVESMTNNKDIRIANPAQSLFSQIPDMEPLAGFFASDACME